MEMTTVSLIISAIVASAQVINFWENRSSKREDKLNIFIKAADVNKKFEEFDEAVVAVDTKMTLNNIHNEAYYTELKTKQAVLEERVDNTIHGIEKIENKIDKILERL